jgi:hypothetical protein
MKGVMSIHSARTHRNITRIILLMPVNLQELIVDWGSSIGGDLLWLELHVSLPVELQLSGNVRIIKMLSVVNDYPICSTPLTDSKYNGS